MEWSEILALLSVAGFATQRTLELLDPLFIFLSRLKLFALLGVDEKAAKTWFMGFAGFGIGLFIALVDNHRLPLMNSTVSDIVIALAISTGSNAANSLMKFGEQVKEARKKEVQPLPELRVTPVTVTISPQAQLLFLASVSGTDNKAITWRVLEVTDGGTIRSVNESTGEYTAPSAPGTYHVAAVSEANPAATATATITVRQP
jgi:hypothetical protein